MNDYYINVFCSEDDSGYIADIPDLESCSAFGKTPEHEVLHAKEAWLVVAVEANRDIPQPRYRPAIYAR